MRPDAILAFDTSAAHCAAAFLCNGRVVTKVEPMAKGQAERLAPMVSALLIEASVGWRDLSAIGVGTGPGNFTGIRIAVAFARGLALGLGIPAVGVTGFEAVAHAYPDAARPFTVTLPAPRGQLYVQRFDPMAGEAGLVDAGAVFGPVHALADLPLDHFVSAIAKVARFKSQDAQPRPKPFYLRGAVAAPPSDPAPVILP